MELFDLPDYFNAGKYSDSQGECYVCIFYHSHFAWIHQ